MSVTLSLCLLYPQTNKPEKTQEFFQKQALELQGQPEWRDWFALPFIPVPEQNPTFSPYFSRQWADTFLVSLHNFLSVLFQCMHIQTLLLPGNRCGHCNIGILWDGGIIIVLQLNMALEMTFSMFRF